MNLQSDNISDLIGALAKAQGKIITAKKDKKNPFFKSNYADLSSVWDACRSALSENGLAVVQSVQTLENRPMELVTTLAHASGQWIKSHMPIITVKNDPQSLGSALTYYRRYALAAIVGVAAADEDDDGNMASNRPVNNASTDTHKSKDESVEKISKKQGDELVQLLSKCDADYQKKFLGFIKKDPIKASSVYDLPIFYFDRAKSEAIKRCESASEKTDTEAMEA